MTTVLVGTKKVPFSAGLFPVTPDTMGSWQIFPREVLASIFINLGLANTALINWTCKEVVERNTPQGERRRFFRIFHLLVRNGSFTRTRLQHEFPLERFCSDGIRHLPSMILNHQDVLPHVVVDFQPFSVRVQNNQLHVVMHMQDFCGYTPYYYISEIDRQIPYPHLGPLKVCFAVNLQTRSIVKIDHDNKTLEIQPAWATDAIELVFQGIAGKWLAVWSTDYSDQGTLHFLDQETLEEDFSYDLSSNIGLFSGQRHVYIQDKFCVILSPYYWLIKMDGRMIKVATWPLPSIKNMTNFSCLHKTDGQMEIRVEGETDHEKICLQHMVDPFEPIGKESPKPRPFFLKVLGWIGVISIALSGLLLIRRALLRK
jgi:hypothetical protein